MQKDNLHVIKNKKSKDGRKKKAKKRNTRVYFIGFTNMLFNKKTSKWMIWQTVIFSKNEIPDLC